MSLKTAGLAIVCMLAVLTGAGSGPLPLPAASRALADDDDGGGGKGLSRGGFGGVGSVFQYGRAIPRIMSGLPRLSSGRVAKRRRDVRRPPPVQETTGATEIVAVGLTPSDLDKLNTLGFTTLGQRQIDAFAASLTRLKIPRQRSIRSALRVIRDTAPGATVSSNDLYRGLRRESYEPEGEGCGARCQAFELTSWTSEIGRCKVDVRVGVVDTGADLSHPSLKGARVTSRTMRSPDREQSDTSHGTAVLSLLVGQPDSTVVGLIHGAEVFHADAFHGTGEDTRTDVYDLVAAIDWLLSQDVKVMNLSFSGPDNAVVHRAIVAAQNKGVHLIAASGRPDTTRTGGYPARYPGVIAVSAVDNRLRPSRLAQRGDHLAFVAPGVGITVAHLDGGLRLVDGSSFATPFVAAAYAMGSGRKDTQEDITTVLARSVQDLGPQGRDPTYGWGLIQFKGIPPC